MKELIQTEIDQISAGYKNIYICTSDNYRLSYMIIYEFNKENICSTKEPSNDFDPSRDCLELNDTFLKAGIVLELMKIDEISFG